MIEYAVFIPWIVVAFAGSVLLLAADGAEKLIEYIQEKMEDRKALHSGRRFYVS